MSEDQLEERVRLTLRTAAERMDVDMPPFSLLGTSAAPAAAEQRRRWVVPLLAASLVVAMALTVPTVISQNRRAADARTLTTAGDSANVGGVRFPVPAGWDAVVTASTSDVVTVCVAMAPSTSCDGVQLGIAVPQGDGDTSPLDAAFTVRSGCGADIDYLMRDDPAPTVGGRPANHYWRFCGPNGPQAHLWELTDLSLQITTPAGRWADQGADIAAGLDLSGWPHPPGPQLVFTTSATSATTN